VMQDVNASFARLEWALARREVPLTRQIGRIAPLRPWQAARRAVLTGVGRQTASGRQIPEVWTTVEMWTALRRLVAGKCHPSVEVALLHYVYGRPPEKLEVSGADGAAMVYRIVW